MGYKAGTEGGPGGDEVACIPPTAPPPYSHTHLRSMSASDLMVRSAKAEKAWQQGTGQSAAGDPNLNPRSLIFIKAPSIFV